MAYIDELVDNYRALTSERDQDWQRTVDEVRQVDPALADHLEQIGPAPAAADAKQPATRAGKQTR